METPLTPLPTCLARWLLVTLPFANAPVPAAENAAGPTEGKAARRLPLAAGCRGHSRRYSHWYWSSERAAAALSRFFFFSLLHLNFHVRAFLLIIK